ncbi:rhamnogalacturonan lyase B N-terminal domain-containing protein [Xanthomonas theicola]|uniref:rhamnogalacturonan lyase B N-terminal domain-containing protein n=1 Tax=Xanthomonas theicola TaxID=56464 RepID=UPI001639C396|nr:rhamnogalacturonan lyase B N-terminal domain-containing protein [Xanthomonas theicola]QNH23895.1 hypothetical protein G4Q83_02775 [Xanthomonas theicola]
MNIQNVTKSKSEARRFRTMLLLFGTAENRRSVGEMQMLFFLRRKFMGYAGGLILSASCAGSAIAQETFGVTEDQTAFTVDTGGDLVFKVRKIKPNNNTQSIGDLASLVYRGIEYQDQSRGSQLNVGAGYLFDGGNSAQVRATKVDDDRIVVTVAAGNLTHYYMAKRGEPRIYMATAFDREPMQGLVRYILRVPFDKLPDGPAASDLHGCQRTIEAADICSTATGETRSKHYSNMRLKDWHYIGAKSKNVGLWFVRDNGEGMTGGPFYRSLLNQGTTDQELTYIINYGMAQTEAFRTGTLNLYTLVFTNGAAPPDSIDTSWMDDLSLKGYLSYAKRGAISGSLTGQFEPQYFDYTVAFKNGQAQYWTKADTATGQFTSKNMRPGQYTMLVCKNELVVDTREVTVGSGHTNDVGALSIANDPSANGAVWRIGEWDGTPAEFLNGDKVTWMHPSDSRLRAWAVPEYVVGESNAETGFPAYQWTAINGEIVVRFNLSQDQLKPSSVHIGATIAFAGARPMIKVNDYAPRSPGTPNQPNTRNLTVGTYRGNNTYYSFAIPQSALKVGDNVLRLSPISGSQGAGYLSPGFAYDAIEFAQ